MRRGAAQWANASYEISIQWLCSRGMWTMDALSKAFAYLGMTLTEDQKIAKRLSVWDPDDKAVTPSLGAIVEKFAPHECEAILRFQKNLFASAHCFDGGSSNCNIQPPV